MRKLGIYLFIASNLIDLNPKDLNESSWSRCKWKCRRTKWVPLHGNSEKFWIRFLWTSLLSSADTVLFISSFCFFFHSSDGSFVHLNFSALKIPFANTFRLILSLSVANEFNRFGCLTEISAQNILSFITSSLPKSHFNSALFPLLRKCAVFRVIKTRNAILCFAARCMCGSCIHQALIHFVVLHANNGAHYAKPFNR